MLQKQSQQLRMFEEKTSSKSSLPHLEIAKNNSDGSKKDLAATSSGKFYTPVEIGMPLAKNICDLLGGSKTKRFRVIDPFAGDGRLIVWLIENIQNSNTELEISIWDYDNEAIKTAASNIRRAAEVKGIKIQLFAENLNTFSRELISQHQNQYDVVITNPPWDVVKPDRKELEVLDEGSRIEYIKSLKIFSNELLESFPLSKPRQMYGGWGVNLARVGTEIAMTLGRTNSIVGVVSPSTLLADQNSQDLRSYIFGENFCQKIDIFPAESRLFKSVDQPSVSFIVVKGGGPNDIDLAIHDDPKNVNKTSHTVLPKKFLHGMGFIIPVNFTISPRQIDIVERLRQLRTIGDLESDHRYRLWTGRELDETGYSSWVTTNGKMRFVKGVMIDRYEIRSHPNFFLKEDAAFNIPNSVGFERIGWRDVTRPSQKRRMIATILPQGCVAGNSVGIAYFRSAQTHGRQQLRTLLAVMSSYVFEFQARLILATAHVSQGIIRKLAIPDLHENDFLEKTHELVTRVMSGDSEAEYEIEAVVARQYGLDEDDMSSILETFPKTSEEERRRILHFMKANRL